MWVLSSPVQNVDLFDVLGEDKGDCRLSRRCNPSCSGGGSREKPAEWIVGGIAPGQHSGGWDQLWHPDVVHVAKWQRIWIVLLQSSWQNGHRWAGNERSSHLLEW